MSPVQDTEHARSKRDKRSATPDSLPDFQPSIPQSLSPQLVQRACTHPGNLTPADVAALQRTVGNRVVQRLLANRAAGPSAPDIQPTIQPRLQRKLRVGAVDDPLEQEANRVARQVTSQLATSSGPSGPTVQKPYASTSLQALTARLPSAERVAAGGIALGQTPEIGQRSPPDRIHRCGPSGATGKASAEPDLANTSPTGGSGGLETRSTGTLDQDQEHAIQLIDLSPLESKHKTRAKLLIENPDLINQTAFGVCGNVAILRSVARSNPTRFAQIIMVAMVDSSIADKWLPIFQQHASEEQKTAGAELEFLTSQWLVRKASNKDVSQKTLTRGSGSEVTETTKNKKYSQVFQEQKDFSDTFDINEWEKRGHFALTSGGLNYMLSSINDKASYKVKVSDFKEDYKLAKARAGAKGSVLAAVTETGFYQKRGAEVKDPANKTSRAKFVHWVMLDDVKESGDYFELDVWTWARHFPAKVHKDVIGTYIYSLVAT